MANLEGGAARHGQSQEIKDLGSVTLGAADREELIAGAQSELAAQELSAGKSRSYGSEPEVVSDVDLDNGTRGPANVLQFPRGASYQSAPTELDASHDIRDPERAGMTGRYSYSSEPGLESYENSVSRVTVIGRGGEVSSRPLAA
ncbi:MAG: hypothetical protein RL417_151 [Pseudomonadota bacterium]|jgi:hypothetical protein